ncbi:hypothetical protein GIB67_001670, partial [Kingdonia uniflora]
ELLYHIVYHVYYSDYVSIWVNCLGHIHGRVLSSLITRPLYLFVSYCITYFIMFIIFSPYLNSSSPN